MIQFYHVSTSYDDRRRAVSDISFKVGKGELVFLTGPSGAGKTTLLRLILCAERADEGQILIAGRNVARLRQKDIPGLRRRIGVVFQDFKLVMRKTIYENVAVTLRMLGASEEQVRRRTAHALKAVGIYHKRDSLPRQVSGGEQQRAAIARALAKNPAILLADEPTGNLDPDMTLDIMRLLREIHAQGATVLIATHDRGMTRQMGSRVVHIEDGRVTDGGRVV